MAKLNIYIKNFLDIQKQKSKRTYHAYLEGLEALENYLSNYNDFSTNGKTSGVEIAKIEPHDIDYILSFFIIRKYICSETFYLHSTRAIKEFFKYLAKEGQYNMGKSAEIEKIAKHYSKQYPRIRKLWDSLWKYVEKDTEELMQMKGTEKHDKRLKELQESVKDYIQEEVGYVEVERIDGNKVFGIRHDNRKKVGPVLVDDESAKLLEVGDIINMITIWKEKDSNLWEICELGYVYPKSYC